MASEPAAGGASAFFVASCLSNQFEFPVDATLLPGNNRREPSAKAINQMAAKPSSRSLSVRDSRSCARLRQRGHLFESHARRLRQHRQFGSADILRLRIRNSTGRQRRHRRDEIARRGCPRRPRFRRSIPGIARPFETAARAFLNFRTASLHDWMSIMEPDRINGSPRELVKTFKYR